MSSFQVIELDFDPIDPTPTLEDEFTVAAVTRDIESVEDIDHLKHASKNLLHIAIQRQAVIRGLCKRLAEIETTGVTKTHYKG